LTSYLERGKKTVLGRSSTVVQTLVPIGVTVAEIAGPSYTKNTDIQDDIIRQNACVCCIIIRAHHEDIRYSEKSTLNVEKYDYEYEIEISLSYSSECRKPVTDTCTAYAQRQDSLAYTSGYESAVNVMHR